MHPQRHANRRNPWTHVLVACCAVFIFTVFLMVAAAFNRQAVALAPFLRSAWNADSGGRGGRDSGLAVVVLSNGGNRRDRERERRAAGCEPSRETGSWLVKERHRSCDQRLAASSRRTSRVPPRHAGEELP